MRRVISWSIVAVSAVVLGGAACAKKEQPSPPAVGGDSAGVAQAGEADAWYVCPMAEDNYWQKGPGRCPKCGMNVVPAPEGWTPPAGASGACTGEHCGSDGQAGPMHDTSGGMGGMSGMEHGAPGGAGMGGMARMPGMEHGHAAAPAGDTADGAPSSGDSQAWYVCPMHPEVFQDHPGDCPICQMHLVEAAAGWTPPTAAGKTSVGTQAPAVRTARDLAPGRVGQQATCPVTNETFTVTDETPAVDYQGTVYLFCCAACPPRFLADPRQYGAPAPAAP